MRITKLQVFALAGLVALAACADAENDEAAPADSLAANADSLNNANANLPAEPVVSGLDDVNDSGIEGEATATHSANDATVSIVLKEGAKADVTYAAHIHSGNCKDGGPVVVELEPIKNLQSTKTIPVSSLPSGQPLFIQVHDPAGKAVACGDMKGHEAGDANRMGDTTHMMTTTTH